MINDGVKITYLDLTNNEITEKGVSCLTSVPFFTHSGWCGAGCSSRTNARRAPPSGDAAPFTQRSARFRLSHVAGGAGGLDTGAASPVTRLDGCRRAVGRGRCPGK